MSTKKSWLMGLFVVVLLLSLSVIWVSAQGDRPPRDPLIPDVPEVSSDYIPIQGRLTDENGTPLNGTYDVTFRLYDVSSGGTALCERVRSVTLTDGLFNTYFSGAGCSIDGRQLYLGIEVEDDGEMVPRQYIDNVPVAWTLRPGAFISGTLGSNAILDIENWASNGRGLRAYAMDQTGINYGVVGASRSPNGYGGYFYNNGGGVAMRAGGTGIIQSEAPTYLWISGNGVRPYHQTDSTIIDMDTIGGALIYRGAAAGFKNVMLPITLPGTLYGQDVRVTDMDIYWQGNTDFDAITAVLLRRQTGVCSTSACYASILQDTADHVCDVGNNSTGCVQHYDLTTNNVLTADSGVLYLTLELGFSGASTWIDLGGVRLTLEYDD
ncbi:MAG: hypothetical protein KJ069_11875 [Anaerolineae bacterium]|nr:hypothetical protein [Anaerolineae bacterium]